MDSWYLLHTKPRVENRVAHFLDQRQIEVFLPQIAQKNEHGEAKKKAFFPGYLFAMLDLDLLDSGIWKWTPGLRYIVKYGDQPVPVPEEVIALINQKISKMEFEATAPNLRFNPGDMVRIKDGPFEDLLAIFEGPTTPSARVRVLLSTLNRTIRVRIEADDLEKAPAHAVKAAEKRQRRTRGRGRPINR